MANLSRDKKLIMDFIETEGVNQLIPDWYNRISEKDVENFLKEYKEKAS